MPSEFTSAPSWLFMLVLGLALIAVVAKKNLRVGVGASLRHVGIWFSATIGGRP